MTWAIPVVVALCAILTLILARGRTMATTKSTDKKKSKIEAPKEVSSAVAAVVSRLALIDGDLPSSHEWYGNASGGGTLGAAHEQTEMHDGRLLAASSPDLFPAGCFHDADEPRRVWRESGWTIEGVPSSPPLGHAVCGVSGTPFEGYAFVWHPDGSYSGRWARPRKG